MLKIIANIGNNLEHVKVLWRLGLTLEPTASFWAIAGMAIRGQTPQVDYPTLSS